MPSSSGFDTVLSFFAGRIAVSWLPAVGGDGELTYYLFYDEDESDDEGTFIRDLSLEELKSTVSHVVFNESVLATTLTNMTQGANCTLLLLAVDEDGDASVERDTVFVIVADEDPVLEPGVEFVPLEPSNGLDIAVEGTFITLKGPDIPSNLAVGSYVGAKYQLSNILGKVVHIDVQSLSPPECEQAAHSTRRVAPTADGLSPCDAVTQGSWTCRPGTLRRSLCIFL